MAQLAEFLFGLGLLVIFIGVVILAMRIIKSTKNQG